MILGIGVDLVEIPRMQRILDRPWARRFIERVFRPEEITVCEKAARPAEAYAARFAAKEAVVKAFGTGFSRGITPAAIVVCGGERTRPTIHLLARSVGSSRFHECLGYPCLSDSHSRIRLRGSCHRRSVANVHNSQDQPGAESAGSSGIQQRPPGCGEHWFRGTQEIWSDWERHQYCLPS